MVDSEPTFQGFSKEDWWEICSDNRPELTRERFNEVWAKYVEIKKKREIQ